MSRIIDVVNKIMQISGEMNTFKILSAFIEVSKGKNVSFRNLQLLIYGKAKGRGR